MDTQLNPCRICGGEAELTRAIDPMVICSACQHSTQTYKTEAEAIGAWNVVNPVGVAVEKALGEFAQMGIRVRRFFKTYDLPPPDVMGWSDPHDHKKVAKFAQNILPPHATVPDRDNIKVAGIHLVNVKKG